MDMKEIVTSYYLRIQAMDRPGVLSKISGIACPIIISASIQWCRNADTSGTVPVVFLTHLAREADIQDACRQIGQLTWSGP
jgi:homoserine dehydrogenase